MQNWSAKTDIPVNNFLKWLGLSRGKYHEWKQRFGQANRHNGLTPRHFWLLEWERKAIVAYAMDHPMEGYRRLTFMMLDGDVVAVSPSSVYRVLKAAGLLRRQGSQTSRKGNGFEGPKQPHEHWHIDISYINIAGTFYYLSAVLDGYSRYIVHWEIRERMLEQDIEIVLERARERFPEVLPRIISDNGPQFIAKDFKEYIRIMGMTHVRTSPYYPQSNGKLERWHQSVKNACIRPKSPVSLPDARALVEGYVIEYNTKRLHSAIGYITPLDKLEGRADAIFAARQDKLQNAAKARIKAYTLQPEAQVT
ncbi:MAG: IS3 family transposase [Methylococcales bacterium]